MQRILAKLQKQQAAAQSRYTEALAKPEYEIQEPRAVEAVVTCNSTLHDIGKRIAEMQVERSTCAHSFCR